MARREASAITRHHSSASWTAPPPTSIRVGERDVVAPRHLAGERDEADLRSARPQVDGEDEAFVTWEGHSSPGTCWYPSIMSAMTALMKVSASSVMPPATPP